MCGTAWTGVCVFVFMRESVAELDECVNTYITFVFFICNLILYYLTFYVSIIYDFFVDLDFKLIQKFKINKKCFISYNLSYPLILPIKKINVANVSRFQFMD